MKSSSKYQKLAEGRVMGKTMGPWKDRHGNSCVDMTKTYVQQIKKK